MQAQARGFWAKPGPPASLQGRMGKKALQGSNLDPPRLARVPSTTAQLSLPARSSSHLVVVTATGGNELSSVVCKQSRISCHHHHHPLITTFECIDQLTHPLWEPVSTSALLELCHCTNMPPPSKERPADPSLCFRVCRELRHQRPQVAKAVWQDGAGTCLGWGRGGVIDVAGQVSITVTIPCACQHPAAPAAATVIHTAPSH